jgi:hypothetical protein
MCSEPPNHVFPFLRPCYHSSTHALPSRAPPLAVARAAAAAAAGRHRAPSPEPRSRRPTPPIDPRWAPRGSHAACWSRSAGHHR